MKWIIRIVCLIISLTVSAQNEDIDLETFAERFFQIQEEDIAYEDIYESLLLLYEHKLNLNKATPEDFSSLYILNPSQISEFFAHRDRYGKLLSINELQSIPAFDLSTIRMLKPFVSVNESILDSRAFFERLIQEENAYFLFRYSRRLEKQVGYTEAIPIDTTFVKNEEDQVIDTLVKKSARYLGPPSKIYGRFRTSHKGDFSIGLTFEKDAGERVAFNQNQYGFDFYSYHLFLENKLGFDAIILGDFQLQWGQGLVFGSGFSAGKGAETIQSIKRNSIGFRPYTSVLESGFFRGIGITKTLKKWSLLGFYSKTNQDGNIRSIELDDAELEERAFISSIQHLGLHRTQSELDIKDQVTETNTGVGISFHPNNRFKIEFAGLHSTYSVLLKKRETVYNLFEFTGKRNYLMSVNATYSWRNFILFGESARSKSGGLAMVSGIIASVSPRVDFSFSLRDYHQDFHSFYGNAFSEGSRIINEKGTYWGIQIKPSRHQKFNAYFDTFTFPWLKYRVNAPSNGYEYLMRYTYSPSKQTQCYVQYRSQEKEVSVAEAHQSKMIAQRRSNYLFSIDHKVGSNVTFKTKVQGSRNYKGNTQTKGFALIQDIGFKWWQLKIQTRMALFDTDDFSNAQYVYEKDVLYAFTIPAYNGRGIRNYIVVRYDPLKNISIWMKYARTKFTLAHNQEGIGSSLEQTVGDVVSEIKFMMRVKI